MIWQDLFLNRKVTRQELLLGLKNVFNVEEFQIFFTDSTWNQTIPGYVKVLCLTYICKAEFSLRITIYLRDHQLIPKNDVLIVGKLCELLKCHCLISDVGDNPYSMIQIKNSESSERVFIQLDKYEECIDYELL
ncbi:hypothetical protein BC351_29210 [Paenibacillus ferrarius]|uniref:Uncharacterized protein n=1 Tax=Paenibacillus ferrarius TaxID=1469647 RepID=A0A1V4HHD6_9BACL|nr:hypothetical protein BC351_29210 [Paenibacillus ferrarius]